MDLIAFALDSSDFHVPLRFVQFVTVEDLHRKP